MRLVALLAMLAACADVPPEDDSAAGDPIDESFLRSAAVHGITEGSPDALGVLRVANEVAQAQLHGAVKLTTTAARNIVAARPLATLKQLDDVPYVGTTAFQHLLDYARANGYVPAGNAIQTVFLIVLENHNWSAIKGSARAPYINGTLLPMAAHAEGYYNPPSLHPSEPNYLWLEGGDNFGITSDASPATNHVASHAHLAYLLEQAGVSWKSYQEDIAGTSCPLTATGKYAPKHDPFVFFDDMTGGGSASDARCIAHVRPYGELAADLAGGTVARYNFITPNLCDDMHDACAPTSSSVQQGDDWLAAEVPKILASKAYQDGGVLLITWDEAGSGDGPIGMIALSPLAKAGYANTIRYSHSSTLRTLEEVFGVAPLLGDAANATDLSDLFREFP